jgi:hypothetical protein
MNRVWLTSLLCISIAGCSNRGHSSIRVSSPNGTWTLEATSDDHGSLAPAVTVVNLHLSPDGWKSENNVLIVPGAHTISAHWESNNAVHIECVQCPLGDAELITTKKGPISVFYDEAEGAR